MKQNNRPKEAAPQQNTLPFWGQGSPSKGFFKIRGGVFWQVNGAFGGGVYTNERWKDGTPFDAGGRGTSDLDVTLVGAEVMEQWDKDAFYIPGLHTKPLCDEDPGIAAGLNPLREELQELAGRPVNFQATSNLILFARDVLFVEPYFMLIEPEKGS